MARMEKWREDPVEELVKIFKRSELSTFWTSNIDLVIGPGETLVWIRDGKIEDIVTQTRLNNVAGGFRNWIASKSSGGKEIKMMIIDNGCSALATAGTGDVLSGILAGLSARKLTLDDCAIVGPYLLSECSVNYTNNNDTLIASDLPAIIPKLLKTL